MTISDGGRVMRRRNGWSVSILVCCLALFMTGAVSPALAGVRVEYRTSRMFGLFLFASTISGFPNRPEALRNVFQSSAYNTERTRTLITEFRGLHQVLLNSFDFGAGPANRPRGTTLEQLFMWRALDSDSLRDLQLATQGLMPVAQQARYFEILSEFEKIYDPLIWRDNQAKMERYRVRLASKGEEWRLGELFEKAACFYGAEWPSDLPFTIALYPIPAATGSTSAESFGSLETVAVLLDEKDITQSFAVIFHELCHSLYGAEPLALQNDLDTWFTQADSSQAETPHAELAYAMINEGLASAVGNGWAYGRAAGHPNSGSWYNDEIIDGFAKALYPAVSAYIESGKPLDQPFVRTSIETFGREFPDAPFRFDLLFREIVLMTDGIAITSDAARNALRARFRISSIYHSSPINDERTLQFLDGDQKAIIVIVGHEEADQLASLEPRLPALAGRLKEMREAPGDVVLVGREGGRTIVVMKLRDANRLEIAAAELGKLARVDPVSGNWITLN